MEVVPAADVPLALPFARSNVQEWSHLDQLTGVLQQGRVHAHHWASATRAYGKVVDSRRVASASGGLEQRRLQQVEVFQERGPGGSRLHVVRASRHSTSSSSTTTTNNNSSSSTAAWRKAPAFDNLQLPLNPLDSSPQKTRASVGRSGSIGGRRPPSRPRSLVGKSEAAAISEEHHDLDLNHDDDLEIEVAAPRIEASTATSSEDDDGGGGGRLDRSPASARRHSHSGVARKKSSSTEDLHCATPEEAGQAEADSAGAAHGEDWRRDARVRRSLQFPGKASLGSPRLERPELPAFKSGSALRGLEALESVFRRGANIADSVNRTLADGGAGGDDALDVDSLAGHLRHEQQMASSEEEGLGGKGAGRAAAKRHSFVTVEKLKEVRGRLRRLGSPPSDEASADPARSAAIAEERDDGIVTEEPDKREACGPAPRIRSFVYGMDAAARKTVPGTGSLESRTSNRSSSSSGSRSEEWYNRRKSYGFEQVHEPGREAQLYGSTFRDKNKVESSTDSGICRSSETVTPWGRLVGSRTKTEDSHTKTGASTHIPVSPMRASHSIAINKANISVESSDTQRNTVQDEDSAPQRGRSTVVTLGSKFEHRNVDFNNRNSGDSALHNVSAYNSDDDKTNHRRFSEPVTITIPITREDSAAQSDALSNVEQKKQFYRQLAERPLSIAEGNKPFVVNIKKKETNDLSSLIDKRNSFSSDSTQPLLDSTPWRKTESWRSSKQEDGEMKRHSIAEDPRYAKGGANHIMSFSQMSPNDNSEQTFTRISASELAKKFDSLSVSRKEHSQSTLQNGIRQFSAGINVSFVQNGFVRNEEDDEEFSSNQMNMKKQKKVEFCKTEVHFVADSGRVNIVETDEKPPPTNMFRRRKRNNAATVSLQPSDPSKSNLPQVRFGDSPYEKQLLGGNDSSVSEVSHTIHVDIASDAKVVSAAPAKETKAQIPGNFQHDADKEDHIFTQANATISATVNEGNESPRFDSENSDAFQLQGSTDKDNMPRSILKNYRKPRPFLLGENDDLKPKTEAEEGKQDEKWGVRLRPVQSGEQVSSTAMWRSQVSVSTTAFDVPQTQRPLASVSGLDHSFRESENELQRQLRLLRPANKKADAEAFSPPTQHESRPRSSPPVARSFGRERETEDKGVQVTVGPGAEGAQLSSWTVAERIRQVEEMRKASGEVRGFSTRVNFGAGEATVIEAGSSDEQQAPAQKPAGGAFEKTSASKAPWSPRQEAEGYSRTAHEEEVRQLSTVRPPLPTYDSGRLRSVETLVSTRSGHPKITSISLHYEGDPAPADNCKHQSVHSSPKEADSSSPLSAYSTRSEKQLQDKLSVSAEKTVLAEDETLYMQTAPPQQKDAAHKMYDVAAKARAPISYTERCYGDGESGSMSRRSRKSQESDRTYVVDRKRFELQKEKYASERDGHVTGKDSTNEDHKSVTPRGSNTYVKERSHDYKSGKIDTRRQIVETETCEEVKIRSTRERRSVSPEKAYSKDVATVAQKSETLKSTSTVSLEEDEYCGQGVSDDSESAEETYGSVADKKISKRASPIYDNVCGTGDRPKQSEAGKKAGPENGRQIAGKSSAVVKGQTASSTRKVTAVEKRSSRKATEGASGKRRSESPIYENREIICLEKDRKQQQRSRQEQRQHETAMLEELTRAADQILQAVNGYSDDDSNRASSAEDEDRGRRYRRRAAAGGAALCTISEAPPRKGHRQPAGAAAAGAAARRPQRTGAGRQPLGPTSSTSSVDSVSERRAAAVAATAARRERAARLVQRASSREQLLQARASSSEDALSSLEAEERRPRPPPPRRQRPAGTSSSSAAARPQPATQGHKRLSSGDAAAATKTADRTTAKKSLTSHRLRESAKERSTRTVSAKRDLAEVKHNTTRAATDKLPGSSHGLLPSSSKSKNERCISERRTVVAVMPLRPSPSSNVKKIKTTSSRTEGTQAKPVK